MSVTSHRKVDVRVISATNADLPRAIEAGTFREDLYFRLNVIEIALSPLRARTDDIIPLAVHFVESLARAEGVEAPTLSDETQQLLLSYDFPGNVRELENRFRRAFLVRSGKTIGAEDLGLTAPSSLTPPALVNAQPNPDGLPAPKDPEQTEIESALLEARGVVSRAAAQLGMSRQALYRRMERLGIEMERRPK